MLPPSYKQNNQLQLTLYSMVVAANNMLTASAHLLHRHGAEHCGIVDIVVTCDGTWSKHGFTGMHGAWGCERHPSPGRVEKWY